MMAKILLGVSLALVLHLSVSAATYDWELVNNKLAQNLTKKNGTDQALLLIEGECSSVNETDIVLQQTVNIWGFPFITQKKEISWHGDKNITCVTVFVVHNVAHPGSVKIVDGGLKHYYITLDLFSEWSKGIHMLVYLYGK